MSHFETADLLMVLAAEPPGFAQRNFTESVAVISAPSREYMATTCLHRQQPDLNMHAHFVYHLKYQKKSHQSLTLNGSAVQSHLTYVLIVRLLS